jgi:uncharacterized membrane protein
VDTHTQIVVDAKRVVETDAVRGMSVVFCVGGVAGADHDLVFDLDTFLNLTCDSAHVFDLRSVVAVVE